MPIIKSAVKRARQTGKRTARNVRTKRQVKSATKELDAALAGNKKAKLGELLAQVQSELDTAVKKGLIHENQARRKISRYTEKVKAAGGKMPVKTQEKASGKPAKKTAAKKTASATKKK